MTWRGQTSNWGGTRPVRTNKVYVIRQKGLSFGCACKRYRQIRQTILLYIIIRHNTLSILGCLAVPIWTVDKTLPTLKHHVHRDGKKTTIMLRRVLTYIHQRDYWQDSRNHHNAIAATSIVMFILKGNIVQFLWCFFLPAPLVLFDWLQLSNLYFN